jgi:predicted ribosome quality control (RQC) complex YloA/Tae2 family protein
MEHDIASSGRHEDYERFGKLLLANIAAAHKGMEEIIVDDEGTLVAIPLERMLTPAANAQRYFDKAKRSRTAKKEAGERLASVREKISLLSELQSTLASSGDVDGFLSEHADELLQLGLSNKESGAPEPPFRVYRVDGGFEVWAGKNSKSNDELTMKHAKPNDLWFHARGAGGSHVVLRVNSAKGEPGKKARIQAAGIAAWFSKLKGSKMVPVAMTRRKHVRKPKGAPPGTVAIEREEVIIAAPALPESKMVKGKSETRRAKS